MKKTIALASLLALALGAFPAHAAKFYKWTDDKGVTHYTVDPPPAGAKASEVRVKTRSYSDPEETAEAGKKAPGKSAAAAGKTAAGKDGAGAKPSGAKAGDGKETAGKDAKPGPEKYAEKCKALRSNLQSMEEHARVKIQEPNGETRVLTDEEKAARLDATQREIKAYCE